MAGLKTLPSKIQLSTECPAEAGVQVSFKHIQIQTQIQTKDTPSKIRLLTDSGCQVQRIEFQKGSNISNLSIFSTKMVRDKKTWMDIQVGRL